MLIELNNDEAEALRRLLQQKAMELDTEINRTDRLAFKKELQGLHRTLERVLGAVTVALQHSVAGT